MELDSDGVKNKLRSEMNRLADVLASGHCEDIQSYRHITGQIWGLAYAERVVLDMVEAKHKAEAFDE